MAIYHLHVQVLSRARGRSAVAAAAYRAGAQLHDERTGRTHDFTHRRGVALSRIVLPEGAPAWLSDRSRLWNHAEAVERRRNARVAREVRVALPRELTLAEQAQLTDAFVTRMFLDRGLVADWNIHLDRPLNPHAHILVSVRRAGAEGLGAKDRAGDHRSLLMAQRAAWAQAVNAALEQAGVLARVDHRALKARGIRRRPAPRLSQGALMLERQGVVTAVGSAAGRRFREWEGQGLRGLAPRGSVRALLSDRLPARSRGRRREAVSQEARHRLERILNVGCRRPKRVRIAGRSHYVGIYRGRVGAGRHALLERPEDYVLVPIGPESPALHRPVRLDRRIRMRGRRRLISYRAADGRGRSGPQALERGPHPRERLTPMAQAIFR